MGIDGNQVSSSAEAKRLKEENKDKNLIYSERYQGKVYRSFTLDHEIESRAQAKYADDVLELVLPKKTEGKGAKQVSVQ